MTALNVFALTSSPMEGDTISFEDKMIHRLCRLIGNRILEEDDEDVADAVKGFAALDRVDRAYRCELGSAAFGLTSGRARGDREGVLAHFLANAFFAGALHRLDRTFKPKDPICICGCIFDTRDVRLTGGAGRLSVDCLDTGDRREFVYSAGLDCWHDAVGAEPFNVGTLGSAIITSGGWAAQWGEPDPEPRPVDMTRFKNELETSFALLEEYAPEYYLWTAYLLREAVPKGRVDETTTTSASYRHAFGVVEICSPASTLEVAEMLVHECSHLHYHLVCWATRTVLDGAPKIHSILKRTERPLEMILVGFHAFANALLMYREIAERGAPVDPGELQGRATYVRGLVDSLYSALVLNKEWLSPSGLSIYQPLADRLVDAGLADAEDLVRGNAPLEIEVV